MKAEDFNLGNVSKDIYEMVQYVIDNVAYFDARYHRALDIIDKQRCPLSVADNDLYADIQSAMAVWAIDNTCWTDDEFDEIDIDEIF